MMPTFDPDSYATPEKRAQVYELLGMAWPKMPSRIPLMEAACCPWSEVSTPFVLWEDGTPIAHAGVVDMELVLDGKLTLVGGIHAVVTHPDHRGRGHMRHVMERAIKHCDDRYATTILFGDPPMYERYGFRNAPRFTFRADVAPVEKKAPFGRLEDLGFLRGLLERRDHLSDVLGVRRSGHMFICDVLLASGSFEKVFRAGDVVVSYRVKDGELFLFDVVAERLPPLAEILARVPEEVTSVRFGWTPDRVDVDGIRSEPQTDDDPLMVRGTWPLKGREFDFPYLTVC